MKYLPFVPGGILDYESILVVKFVSTQANQKEKKTLVPLSDSRDSLTVIHSKI
jgi:hypothetical protein